ncbi:MAG: MFS transporter [Syntrophobacteraceae bacterium]
MNISERLERLPLVRLHWKILLLCGIGWMFDSMDVGLVSFVMPAVQKQWNLSPSQLGTLGSITMAGMCIGAAVVGMLSDKLGRRQTILYTLVLYGLMSGLAGLSTSLLMLVIVRFFVGVGLGGELPAASTLVAEFSPAKNRGRMVVLLESFWAWGWILAALIAYLVIPVYGWRVAFFLGALPALYAAYLRKDLPESPRYLELVGREREAEEIVSRMERSAGIEPSKEVTATPSAAKTGRMGLAQLFSSAFLRRTVCLWIMWFGLNFGYYGFVIWIPTLMVGKGFLLIKSLQYTLIMTLAQLPGYFSAAYRIEVIGRKAVLVIFFLGTALAAHFYGLSDSVTQILIWGCLLYFFSLGTWGAVYAYGPELYPTEARASGVGWAAAFGRIGAMTAPFVVGLIYQSYGKDTGYGIVFGMLTGVFILVALSVLILGVETKGKTLDELTRGNVGEARATR